MNGKLRERAMTFAEKLRQLRDAAGLSEAKLAAASGVSFPSVHQYGLGLRSPSYSAVVKLAAALGVDCTAFADCAEVAHEPAKRKAATSARRKPGKRK
jgi:transcriptional regulator with XRE-family HTH domain